MNLETIVFGALRVSVLLGLALAAMPLLSRAPAATRRLVLALGFAGALVVPVVTAITPAWRVAPRPSFAALHAPFAETAVEANAAPAALSPGRLPTSNLAVGTTPRLSPSIALAGLWAVGALLVLARLCAGVVSVRRIVRRAALAPAWDRATLQVERVTGARAEVRLTDDLDGPAVVGVLSPVVLVPRASHQWSDARRVAVLHHELAHVRQMDCLTQLLSQLVCALHWPNPLAWIAARRLRLERELAADDAVIAAGTRATSYAEDLLLISGARPAPVGALGMAERSQLSARVEAIVSPGRARSPLSRPRALMLVTGATGVLFAVACASPADSSAPSATTDAVSPLAAPRVGSTIDPRLQRLAEEEIDRTAAEWQPSSATILVLDPRTGAILANTGRERGARADVALGRVFVTGSTFKAVTLAAALDEGLVTPSERFDCENGEYAYGGHTLQDSHANGVLSVPEMLAVSSNIGFAKVFDRRGGDRLGHWLRRFRFGVAPAVPGAATGVLPSHIEDRSFEGAGIALGAGPLATPLQVAAAYAALANDGVYLAPTLERGGSANGEAIVRPSTARAVVAMLEEAVDSDRATGKLARIAGVRVAGKTGTADAQPDGVGGVYASFVGIVPADHPRFVILVGVASTRSEATGGTTAAPVFARLASAALGG